MFRIARCMAAVFALILTTGGTAEAALLRVSCGAVGIEFELCKEESKAWAAKTGNTVEFVPTPDDSDARLTLYQQVLGAGSDKIDVLQVDVIWPGILAADLLDLRPYTNGVERDHYGGIIANNMVKRKLVAMPWFIDSGMLFYRKDLLQKYGVAVPTTWEELTATAKRIQEGERAAGNKKMWGYVWQGRAYEGLSCNALEWLASSNGGTIVNEKGIVTVNNSRAVRALDMAAGWVGSISPKAVLGYGEEDSRKVFHEGNAVFLRNWPYVWSIAQGADSPIKGKIGVAPLPKGGADGFSVATLGGSQLAVSRFTKNPQAAADLVMYLTSVDVQKDRAVKGSFNPTLGVLYWDMDVLKAYPQMAAFFEVFGSAVARPSAVAGGKYKQLSAQFWAAVHKVLSGEAKAPDALAELEEQLQALAPGGRWK